MTDSLDGSPAFQAMVEAARIERRKHGPNWAKCETGVYPCMCGAFASDDPDWFDRHVEEHVQRAAFSATTSRPCGTCEGTGSGPELDVEGTPAWPCSACHGRRGRVLEWAAPQVLVELGQMERAVVLCDDGSLVDYEDTVPMDGDRFAFRVVPPRDVEET